jgi:solute carrier family 38 (sodium-coupled neutral amino acid transporter), member 11
MSIVFAGLTGIDIVAQPWVKRLVLVAIASGIVLPLACLKNMAALTKTSLLSICAVLFVTFVVVLRSMVAPPDMLLPVGDQTTLKFIDVNFFPAVGIISFAFVCHHACFLVYNTLRDNTEARWNSTVHSSFGVACGVMLTLAMAAYVLC